MHIDAVTNIDVATNYNIVMNYDVASKDCIGILPPGFRSMEKFRLANYVDCHGEILLVVK